MNISQKAINIPYPGGDLYSRDNLYFSGIKAFEEWDLSHIGRFSFQLFSFLIMRSFLHHEKYSEPLMVKNISADVKKYLSLGGVSGLRTLCFDAFIPEIKKGISGDIRFESFGNGFSAFYKNGKSEEISGGFCGQNNPEDENKDFDYLYKNILGNKGVVYFRTTALNIVMFSEKNEKPERIYTQEKGSDHSEFTFYYMKKETNELQDI